MPENLFFNRSQLKYCGKHVIIGKTVRIRYPELVELHDNVVIDDFTYISCGLIMGTHSMIEPNCVLTGGQKYKVVMGDHAGISSHSTAYCSIHDFKIFLHTLPDTGKDLIQGDINIGNHAGVGSHSIILPGVTFGEGARTIVNTVVKKDLEPWTLYGGPTARKLLPVDKEAVMQRYQEWKSTQS
jgi:acetyltransferase-like isoleucine patch superfamily enzyme